MVVKRFVVMIILMVTIGLLSQSSVIAQGTVVNPPVFTVDLGALETPTGNIAAQVSFSFEQGANFADEVIEIPTFVYSRDISYPGQTSLVACGINGTPNAILTDPTGQSQAVTLNFANWGLNSNCYDYSMPWAVGTRLGQYTLQISGDNGSVSRTWQLAYPDYPTTLYTIPNEEVVLMGFAPNQVVTVLFYGFNSFETTIEANATFWASRQIQADAQGAAVVRLNRAITAPFDSVKYLIDGYAYAHLSWRRYDDWRELNNYSTPDTMIRQYYDAINRGWYDMAWENLSENYKDLYNAGSARRHDFEPFRAWWSSVQTVTIQSLEVFNQQNGFATVRTNYGFTMRDGRQSSGTTDFIVYFSPTERRWVFYDQN